MGYYRAGFDVVGVDLVDRGHPFPTIIGDALDPPVDFSRFDMIHASPPCQAYSTLTPDRSKHPNLYEPTRQLLISTGLPWVIENVIGAPYSGGVVLCGTMFGLGVRRHRNFETSHLILQNLVCDHANQPNPVDVTGHTAGRNVGSQGGKSVMPGGRHANKWKSLAHGGEAMGIDWMGTKALPLAIPPAYTEHIGNQMMPYV